MSHSLPVLTSHKIAAGLLSLAWLGRDISVDRLDTSLVVVGPIANTAVTKHGRLVTLEVGCGPDSAGWLSPVQER